MPYRPKYATPAEALEARINALRKYATPEDAKEARRQQTRQWRQDHKAEQLAEQAAIARLSLPRPSRGGTPAKYVPVNTHCPGSVAFQILYGSK